MRKTVRCRLEGDSPTGGAVGDPDAGPSSAVEAAPLGAVSRLWHHGRVKFAAEDQNYLKQRELFSAETGPRELWGVVDHWPLYAGVANLARYLSISDLLRSTLGVPGHVAEFGTWRGATLMLLAKLLRIHDPSGPKVVHCFDTFEGLSAFADEDGDASKDAGRYRGSYEELLELMTLYDLGDDIDIHRGLIEDSLPALIERRPEISFSFVYCDTDLYDSTATILRELAPRVVAGGLIVFDEWNTERWPGEGIAVNEYLNENVGIFTVEAPLHTRQPTLALRKR